MRYSTKALALMGGIVFGATGLALPASAQQFVSGTIDYFYLELEGGYGFVDGVETDTAVSPVEPDGGAYGTVTLGHEDPETGILWGYVDRAELWFSLFDHGDDNLSAGGGTLDIERSYWEIGTRFQHYFEQPTMDKYATAPSSRILWGFEPFYGQFDEDIVETGPGAGVGELQTDIVGALLSLEGEWDYSASTTFLARAAAGAYHGDADFTSTAGSASNDFGGFRGQLAAGVNQRVSDAVTIGVMGRLDYFSAVGDIDGGTNGRFSDDDLLVLSIGANVNVKLGGRY